MDGDSTWFENLVNVRMVPTAIADVFINHAGKDTVKASIQSWVEIFTGEVYHETFKNRIRFIKFLVVQITGDVGKTFLLNEIRRQSRIRSGAKFENSFAIMIRKK